MGTPFEWVVPHTCRKTVVTLLDAGGFSARVIADQLSHSRISMTQDVYMGRHAVDEAVATALEGLATPDDDGPESGLRRWADVTTPIERNRCITVQAASAEPMMLHTLVDLGCW